MRDHSVVKGLLVAAGIALLFVFGGSAAAAVPAGFQPLSFTAVTEQDFWLLGTAPCKSGRCTAIVRTVDGGKTFSHVKAPALPRSGTTPVLRFADHADGFAFIPWSSVFYATHDGGATWRRLSLGRILGFASGGGTAFVATSGKLERSPVSANAWRSMPLPFPSDGSTLDLEAHQANLWLLGTRRGGTPSRDELARSTDGGRTFHVGAGPCVPGLGGELAPTSATVVWAVCPTGMLGGAWRSTNGGVTFAHLRTPQLVNSARIAPASASTAVIDRGGTAGLIRTTDGGKSWRALKRLPGATSIVFVGFTDARVGVALVETGYDSSTKTELTALWRTTDAGATWSHVPVR
jgi:hypothetical protein